LLSFAQSLTRDLDAPSLWQDQATGAVTAWSGGRWLR
jgi:hypothetical protein